MSFPSNEFPLMAQLCQPEFLYVAWRKVRANKGSAGSDGVTIQQFEANLGKHLKQLARQLSQERYYPSPIRRFSIKKSSGGTRELAILTLQDRIVQRAVRDLIEPIFEAQFLDCSFGFRPNLGVANAIASVVAYRAEGNEWVVDADIEKFFDTLDHQIIVDLLRISIQEPPLLRLLQMWLDMDAIFHTPPPPPLLNRLENTARYLSTSVERSVTHLLHRGKNVGSYADPDVLSPLARPVSPQIAVGGDWEIDESADDDAMLEEPVDLSAGIFTEARREALANLGRDGLLLLLSSSKGLFKRFSTKQLLLAAPVLLSVLAAPTIGGAIKSRLTRPRKVGTLQGSPLSPLLANVYLHEFDKAMTQANLRLVRYADDFLILCPNESRARHALAQTSRRLATLKLQLNSQKTRIARLSDGVTFLGHLFDNDGCYQPVPKAAGKVIRDRMHKALKKGVAQVGKNSQNAVNASKRIATKLTQPLKKKRLKEAVDKHQSARTEPDTNLD